MAIDDSRFLPEAPPFARSNPQAYYAWLTSNGFPHRVAYDQTTAIFGQPKSPEEQQREAAKQQQQAGLAQTGGAVLGAVGTGYLASQFGGTAAASTPTLATPTVVGVKAVGTGAGTSAGAGTAGATTTGGAATGGGASGGAATTGSTSLGSIGSVALPIAGTALTINSLWESGMKDIVRGKADKADYTNIGLAAGTMGLSEVANIGLRMMGKRSIGSMMKTSKSGVQRVRDSFRSDLQASGVADDKYMVTLADGSKFNIGLDGKTKYQNLGKNIDGKTTRNAWDVDWSNPLAKFATDKIEPMIRNIYGPDNKKAKYMPGQFTGILVNAATSNAKSEQDVIANIETMLGKSKFAQQAGVGVQPPPPPRPAKGQVVRVSPGMYMNDKGQVKPAETVREALRINYGKTKEKEKEKK